MTPEERARFEATIKAGEEVIKPYTGTQYRLDLIDWVYFVDVYYSQLGHAPVVYCHAIQRGSYGMEPTHDLTVDDPLYVAAVARARA